MTTVYNDDACIRSLGGGTGGGNSEPPVVLTYTDTHQLILEDLDVSGNVVEMASSEAIEVIVPLDATLLFTPANQAMFVAGGTGDVTFVGETPEVVINSKEGMLTLNGQYAGARLYKRNEPNQWGLVGDLKSGVLPLFRMLAPDAATSSFTIAVEMNSGEATIDWGDGSEPTVTSGGIYSQDSGVITNDKSHDYIGFMGDATVVVTGDVKRIKVVGSGITEVLSFGNFQHYMLNSSDLIAAPTTLPETVNDMSFMFQGAPLFNQLLPYETSNVTRMVGTFFQATSYNQPITFDMSNVEDLSLFLTACAAFDQPINFNCGKATSLSALVASCTSFNSSIALDLTSAINLDYLVSVCPAFNQPITLFAPVATTAVQMFSGDSSLNQPINITAPLLQVASGFLLLATVFNSELNLLSSSLTIINDFIKQALAYNQPLNLNVSNVTNMDSALNNTSAFDQDISNWCVTNILSEPVGFSTGSALTEPHKPVWGTCPV